MSMTEVLSPNLMHSLFYLFTCCVQLFSRIKLSILLDNEAPKYKRKCSHTTAFTSQSVAKMACPILRKGVLLLVFLSLSTSGKYMKNRLV